MKYRIICISLILVQIAVFGQEKKETEYEAPSFGSRAIAGLSFSYLREAANQGFYLHQEFFSNANFAISASRHFYLGINASFINTWSRGWEPNTYLMFGPFVQFDFLPKSPHLLLAELSIQASNYCRCFDSSNEYPYKQSGLFYAGFGSEINFFLRKQFYLDLSAHLFLILNKVTDHYGGGKIAVGINYVFDLRK